MTSKKLLQLQITTPEKVVYQDSVNSVTLPTKAGEITVLPDHMPLFTQLQAGEIIAHTGEQMAPMAVSGGFAKVDEKGVAILADTAERVEDLDEKRSLEAKERAERLLNEKRIDAEEFAQLSARIERELVRLKVINKWRSLRKLNKPE